MIQKIVPIVASMVLIGSASLTAYPQVKLHLILPCSNAEQTEKWTAEQKKEFHRILSLADDEAVKICGTAITVVPLFFYDLSSYLCIFIFANFGWEIDVVLSHCIVRR